MQKVHTSMVCVSSSNADPCRTAFIARLFAPSAAAPPPPPHAGPDARRRDSQLLRPPAGQPLGSRDARRAPAQLPHAAQRPAASSGVSASDAPSASTCQASLTSSAAPLPRRTHSVRSAAACSPRCPTTAARSGSAPPDTRRSGRSRRPWCRRRCPCRRRRSICTAVPSRASASQSRSSRARTSSKFAWMLPRAWAAGVSAWVVAGCEGLTRGV